MSLTLMAVHAHPDDESIGTGGVFARYADEGIRTVLVTCTNGELGDAPGRITPDDPRHDEAIVVETRMRELQESCDVLGITDRELLGYHDSGMMGWAQNDRPDAFWQADVDEAAKRLAALMERYRPDVVVTYDENGFYGHPDHIQANRITLRAIEMTGIPRKLYYTAVGKRAMVAMAERINALVAGGEDQPKPVFDAADAPFGIDDDLITTIVDVSSVIDRKRRSMEAHASQSDNLWLLSLPDAAFREVLSREAFVRVQDATGAPVPEDDLFAGLR